VATLKTYHSFFDWIVSSTAVDVESATIKCALVTSGYTFDTDHDFFNDITSEHAASGNYTAGGDTITFASTDDDANNRCDWVLGAAQWTTATIGSATGAVYYVDTGGAASTDPLIAYLDFGGAYSSTAGTFDISSSTIRIPAVT